MSEHLNYIRQVSKRPLKRLQMELAKTITKVNPHVVNIRVKTIESGTIKRVYVQAKDTGVLSCVGWVVNDDIQNCMECKTKFGWFTRKHHCRTCGDLVCYQCSGNQSLISGAETVGQQRVCNLCCSKQAAKLSVPIQVCGSSDWGKPLSDTNVTTETEKEEERKSIDDDSSDRFELGGPTHITSVDHRVLSQANELYEGKPHPALVGVSHDLTKEEVAASPVKSTRSSKAADRGLNVSAYKDTVKFVTMEMMGFEQDLLIGRDAVRALKAYAATNPKMLLGWQITLDVNVKPDSIYIIADIRKNAMRKTEFKLVQVTPSLEARVKWTCLKRNEVKLGAEFVPMRKVMFLGTDDMSK